MSIKQHIPNALTCCNLLCGCIGIKFAFEGNLPAASYMTGIAAIFDFLDGFAARILKVNSPIGKDLDSLADMVTFGVLPGVIMYKLMMLAENNNSLLIGIACLIPVFSALRLAKFNNDSRQSDSFIGLPTPANAIMIASFPLITNITLVDNLLSNFYILTTVTAVMSFLLIAGLPLFALKFKTFEWRENKIRYLFLLCCAVLLIIFKFAAIPIMIILYIGLSLLNNLSKLKT